MHNRLRYPEHPSLFQNTWNHWLTCNSLYFNHCYLKHYLFLNEMQGNYIKIVSIIIIYFSGYSMYAKLCFGSFGTFIIKCSIVAMTFGFCCVYLKVFGGIFKSLIELFVVPNDSIYFKQSFYMIIIFFVLMPLMFKEDISSLRVSLYYLFSFIFNRNSPSLVLFQL